MPVVEDKGNWRSQLNSKLANIIANVLGQRVNYTIRYYRHRGHLPNFKHPKDLSERILSSMLSKDFLKYADYADKVKVREYVKAKAHLYSAAVPEQLFDLAQNDRHSVGGKTDATRLIKAVIRFYQPHTAGAVGKTKTSS